MDICNSIQPSDWDCLINHGYTFAIIEAWDGGFGFNHHICIYLTFLYLFI